MFERVGSAQRSTLLRLRRRRAKDSLTSHASSNRCLTSRSMIVVCLLFNRSHSALRMDKYPLLLLISDATDTSAQRGPPRGHSGRCRRDWMCIEAAPVDCRLPALCGTGQGEICAMSGMAVSTLGQQTADTIDVRRSAHARTDASQRITKLNEVVLLSEARMGSNKRPSTTNTGDTLQLNVTKWSTQRSFQHMSLRPTAGTQPHILHASFISDVANYGCSMARLGQPADHTCAELRNATHCLRLDIQEEWDLL
jgi:hypothetical protein